MTRCYKFVSFSRLNQIKSEEMGELLAEKARVAEEEAALLGKKASDAEEEIKRLRMCVSKVYIHEVICFGFGKAKN